MAATVPVQHRTLSEEGYDAASYLWVWRQLTCHMHYICIHGDLYIEALDIFLDVDIRFYVFMVEVCLFISYEVGCFKCYTSPLKLLSNELVV